LLDGVCGGWVALTDQVVINVSHTQHAFLLEHPLGECDGQGLVTAAIVLLVVGAERALHGRLEEVVAEEVERAGENDTGVVAGLQAADQQSCLANRVRVLEICFIFFNLKNRKKYFLGCKQCKASTHVPLFKMFKCLFLYGTWKILFYLFLKILNSCFWTIFHLFFELVFKWGYQSIELVLFYHNMAKKLKEFQFNWILLDKKCQFKIVGEK
jgi:hypothetical protein